VKLDVLCEVFDRHEFPEAHEREHPAKESVLAARTAVTTAVRDDEFVVDCIAHELGLIESRAPRRGLVPFFTAPATGIRCAMGYWPPGSSAGAHEHLAWTITAVCHNELIVQTYDRDESYRQQALVPKHRFDASAGQVGFIYQPCIHDPRNPTDRWSLSLHVTSPLEGQRSPNQPCLPILDEISTRRSVDFGEPYNTVVANRHRQLMIRAIAEFLVQINSIQATDALKRCAREATSSTRRFIEQLGRVDATDDAPRSVGPLVRSHRELALDCRTTADSVVLGVETACGWMGELEIAHIARDAIVFCASTSQFNVAEIPGRLTDDERWAIAETLEDAGLFTFDTTRCDSSAVGTRRNAPSLDDR
jgi:hypothetical protein